MTSGTIFLMIKRIVDSYPDQTALRYGERLIRYNELWEASDRAADSLAARGVGPSDIVGLASSRSPEMLVGLLGILKAGAAYLPLDPSYPESRLAFMLDDAAATCVLIGSGAAEQTNFPNREVIPIVALARSGGGTAGSSNWRTISPESLAYVCYTSGSTGKPKGVPVSHQNLLFFASSMLRAVPMNRDSVVLARTPISFDPHVVELILPLASGAQVVVMDDSTSWSLDSMIEEIDASGVNFIQLTPSLLSALLRRNWVPSPGARILCGGEALTDALKSEVLLFPDVALWNVYGPTETTVWCSALEMRIDCPVRLGGALDGVELRVVSDSGVSVGIGEVGEIYIGGAGVTAGYLGRPDLTAEKFDLLDTARGKVLAYRTGDLARRTGEDEFDYLGRADNQVKVRGYRIELLEVDACLMGIGRLSEVATVVTTSGVLVAYYVPRLHARKGDLQTQLLRHARSSLPEYMVPSRLVELDQLPLGPTLKIDRAALAALPLNVVDMAVGKLDENCSIESPIEEIISSAWCEVLGIHTIPEGATFGQLGGNSLGIVDLRVRLVALLGMDVRTAELWAAGTIRGQAELFRQGSPPLNSAQVALLAEFPASPAQARYLSSTQRSRWNDNVLEFLVQTPALPGDARTAVERLMSSHDAFLISAFFRAEQGWRQRLSVALRTDCIREAALDDTSALAQEINASRSAIDVDSGHMFNWLIAWTAGSTYIHLVCSHLLSDAISMRVLVSELNAQLTNPKVVLPAPLPFSAWVDKYCLEQPRRQRQDGLSHWQAVCQPSAAASHRKPGREALRLVVVSVGSEYSDAEKQSFIVSAAVQAFGLTFGNPDVKFRLVDSGRGIDKNLDDSLTVGWLAQHVPHQITIQSAATELLPSVRRALSQDRSLSTGFGWMRYVDELPALADLLELTDIPLYVNYLPAPPVRHASLKDVSNLLNSEQNLNRQISGVAIVASGGVSSIEVRIYFDSANISEETIAIFSNLFLSNIAALIEFN